MENSNESNQVSQAEFARMQGVSGKTISIWKRQGRLVMDGDKVDVAASIIKLQACRRPRKDNLAAADPFAFAAAIVDPAQRLSVIRALTIAYDAPAVAAICAHDAGLSTKDCYLLWRQMRVSLFEWTAERLAEWGCEPLASDVETPVCFPGAFAEPNWESFADERGEACTPALWAKIGAGQRH